MMVRKSRWFPLQALSELSCLWDEIAFYLMHLPTRVADNVSKPDDNADNADNATALASQPVLIMFN